MFQVVARDKGSLEYFTAIERILRKQRVIHLRSLVPRAYPGRHELLVIILRRATFVAKVISCAVLMVRCRWQGDSSTAALIQLADEMIIAKISPVSPCLTCRRDNIKQSVIFLAAIDSLFFIDEYGWIPAIRSVSRIPPPLTPLPILSVLLTCRPRAALYLHLSDLGSSLV